MDVTSRICENPALVYVRGSKPSIIQSGSSTRRQRRRRRLNDLLTRPVIIRRTSITAINSIELYNLPAMIGGGGLRRNFETIGCLLVSPQLLLLFHLLLTALFLLLVIPPSPRSLSLSLFFSLCHSFSPSGKTAGFRRGYQPR